MAEQKIEGKITIISCRKIEGKAFWGFEAKNNIKGTIWDEAIAKDVLNNLNIACKGMIKSTDDGAHWNLRAFEPANITPKAEKVSDGEMAIPTAQPIASAPTAQRQSVKGSAYEKDPVGLAVEVWCKLADNPTESNMDIAIKLVKQAQDAFKNG